jgi:hypothetical protein
MQGRTGRPSSSTRPVGVLVVAHAEIIAEAIDTDAQATPVVS